MGLGRFSFCLLKMTRSHKTCFETNTESQHVFAHLTGAREHFMTILPVPALPSWP